MRRSTLLIAICTLTLGWSPLEAAAQSIDLFGSSLIAIGTSSHDDIYVYERQLQSWFDSSGYHPGGTHLAVWIAREGRGVAFEQFPKSQVGWIGILAEGGDDFVDVNTDIGALIDGGPGADELHGGEGPDEIYAGGTTFIDFLYGHGDRDLLHAGQNPAWGAFRPHAEMYGGLGTDTYLYGWPDYISDSWGLRGWGWQIRADVTHNSGRFRGMLQVSDSAPAITFR